MENTASDTPTLLYDLIFSADTSSPTERSQIGSKLELIHISLISTMEKTDQVDPAIIQDRKPVIKRWRNQFFIVAPKIMQQVCELLKIETDDDKVPWGLHIPNLNMIILQNPGLIWATYSLKEQAAYMTSHSFTDGTAAKTHFIESTLNSTLAEEYIHFFSDDRLNDLCDKDLGDGRVISQATIKFFDESMTKILTDTVLTGLNLPHETEDNMTETTARLPSEARAVFFGTQADDLRNGVLLALQNTLEKETGKPVRKVIDRDGYIRQ